MVEKGIVVFIPQCDLDGDTAILVRKRRAGYFIYTNLQVSHQTELQRLPQGHGIET